MNPRPHLSSSEIDDLVARAKRHLRARARAVRRGLPAESLRARSVALCARVAALPEWGQARRIGLFWPMLDRNEVDVRPLDELARRADKLVFYPFQDDEGDRFRTGFRRATSTDQLLERGRRFAEPDPTADEAAAGTLDLIVVPALAVSPDGHRLGQGAGWYDATLPDQVPPGLAVAVAYDFEVLAELPVGPRDVPCSAVVTDCRTIVSGAFRPGSGSPA